MAGRAVPLAKMPTKARLEALVDGIFAVSMTLLVLDIRLPEGTRLESNAQLLAHVSSIFGAFLVYVLSFVVLAMFWAAHNYQFHLVQRLDRALLWTNLGFLLLTTMVPFTTNLVSSHGSLSLAVTLYACNLLLLDVTLLLHIRHLRGHPELASAELTPAVGRAVGRRVGLFCAVAALAIVVAQVSPVWALRSFFLLGVIHFLPQRLKSDADAAP